MSPEEIVSERVRGLPSPRRRALRRLRYAAANAVAATAKPLPFDNPAEDEPTDAYLEAFAFWGLGYLDARSWRHYLPGLIDYAFRHPNDPAMVAEALVQSLRPPDRYPPRLAALNADQEWDRAVVS